MAAMLLFLKVKSVSLVGLSALGGTVHNVFQLLAAFFVLGSAVKYYLPFLILAGGISGALTGIISELILKKVKTNGKF